MSDEPSKFFSYTVENVVRKLVAILSWPQFVKHVKTESLTYLFGKFLFLFIQSLLI